MTGTHRVDSPLKREFDYYLAHQDEIVRQHNGKVVVIKDQRIIGEYDDQATAVAETCKNYELGTFLVQKVAPGDQGYTQVFHTSIAFA